MSSALAAEKVHHRLAEMNGLERVRHHPVCSGDTLPPLFLAVALILIQSLNGPAVNKPTAPPTTNAKFTNPTCAGVNKYGGAAKTCDWVKFNAKRQFAANPIEREAQRIIGNEKTCTGATTSRKMRMFPSYSNFWRTENWDLDGRPECLCVSKSGGLEGKIG